ncbi:GerMN domain-containing protein [Polycladomyces subterraneus]|uniref:GerMN domain-containing protein n=1 Tax=Polycladomyces subterraneus TaxID=1016997 RepID=A0ABT8IIU4_9BACL|nr:GerMN domain-containing protein [Polycladomyces subterraneus]MDN4592654.1 GerMN domain-containing protein [Polycladomyces subterraneus]
MRRRTAYVGMVLLLISLLLSGCLYGPNEKTSRVIDPPPADLQPKEQGMAGGTAKAVSAKKQGGVELYLLTDLGYVVPYTLSIPKEKGIAKEALSYLVKDGPEKGVLPKGFSGILPKGTQVKGVNIQDGTATVDFSKEFLSYDPKMENQILSAVTWTLTGFDSVKRVNIWVNGHPLETMPKGKTPAQGLTRAQGINVEMAEGVNVSQSMPVTLYFLGQTPDNMVYYVPVTRMINRTNNVAQATLAELVKGPQNGSRLSSALAETTQVHAATVKGDTVMADFSKELLQYSDQKSASKDAIQTIVLSLTENTGAKKVKITVDGKAGGTIETGQSLEKPVMRPEIVNPGKF